MGKPKEPKERSLALCRLGHNSDNSLNSQPPGVQQNEYFQLKTQKAFAELQSLKALDQTWNVDGTPESSTISWRHRPNRSHTLAYEFRTVAIQSAIRVGFEKAPTYLN